MTMASDSDTIAFFTAGKHGGWGTAVAPADRRESVRVRQKLRARIQVMGAPDEEPVYATVVVTERVGDEAEHLLGVGFRFDQQLYL